MKKQYNIKLLGQEILIQSDKGDEHVGRVVQYVNGKAQELGKFSKDVSTLGISMLVALNIADEMLCLQEECEQCRNRFETKTEELISLISEKKM